MLIPTIGNEDQSPSKTVLRPPTKNSNLVSATTSPKTIAKTEQALPLSQLQSTSEKPQFATQTTNLETDTQLKQVQKELDQKKNELIAANKNSSSANLALKKANLTISDLKEKLSKFEADKKTLLERK